MQTNYEIQQGKPGLVKQDVYSVDRVVTSTCAFGTYVSPENNSENKVGAPTTELAVSDGAGGVICQKLLPTAEDLASCEVGQVSKVLRRGSVWVLVKDENIKPNQAAKVTIAKEGNVSPGVFSNSSGVALSGARFLTKSFRLPSAQPKRIEYSSSGVVIEQEDSYLGYALLEIL